MRGSSALMLSPVAHTFDLTGLTIYAMPPGRVDATFADLPLCVQVSPFGVAAPPSRFSVVGRPLPLHELGAARGGFDIFARGADFEIAVSNPNWELLVEFDDERVSALAAEDHDGTLSFDRPYAGSVDQPVRTLATLAIEHMRGLDRDSLYVEGLAVAIGARALGLAVGRTAPTATRGTDARIARALDFIEAELHRTLSVTELAGVACMSPVHFQRCFRAATGTTVHSHVRTRRIERVKAQLLDGRSLAEAAHASGFSSQSHMGRVFRNLVGATPAEWRRSVRN